VEVPDIIRVDGDAFSCCHSLRNATLASNTVVGEDATVLDDVDGVNGIRIENHAFSECSDLLYIFDTVEAIVIALRNRFNGLTLHSRIYYKSYNHLMTAEEFLSMIIIGENGELDPTGLQQDCLGMTALHILACSTVQCLGLYQVMIEKYPENLIVEDAWGDVPLLYAVWGDAPSDCSVTNQ